ncbi:MAG: acetyl-CoA decarbonylase/synthase complex subunit alpha, partial [Deltaproteobacteria bacterium]
MPKTTQNKSLHSPFPDIFSFRKWDFKLLERYKPFFMKSDKACHLCGLGPCKPSHDNLGKCGINETGFKARAILLDAVIGASGHTSHAARLLEDLIERFGKECFVSAGLPTNIPTPITTLITGRKPENIGEMRDIIAYIEGQLTHLLSSISFGTEASPEDFVSKMLHAGMLDNLAMEIADIAQISAMNMPKGESNSKLINIGLETIDTSKPVILVIGHNSFVAHEIMRLIEGRGLKDKIEVCGLCCAASDGARHSHDFKIIGNQSAQLDVIKSGIADVVILDTQCIRADVVREANKIGSLVIATTQEAALGLEDLTDAPVDKLKGHILKNGAGIILDKKMAAEIALNIGVRKKSINKQIVPSVPGLLRIG